MNFFKQNRKKFLKNLNNLKKIVIKIMIFWNKNIKKKYKNYNKKIAF